MSLLGVCLALAAQAEAVRFVPTTAFTLAWTHSIERTRWEEDYVTTPAGLRLEQARIQGSAAGMEPPEGAVRRGGWYVYTPAVQPDGPLRLTRSPYTADYDWCEAGRCRPLGALLPSDGGVTRVWACEAAAAAATPVR